MDNIMVLCDNDNEYYGCIDIELLSDLDLRCVNKQAGKKQGEGKNLNSATHVPRILIFYVIQRILISPNIMVASVWTVEVQILLLPAEFRHFSNPCTEVCVHARCRLDRLSVNVQNCLSIVAVEERQTNTLRRVRDVGTV